MSATYKSSIYEVRMMRRSCSLILSLFVILGTSVLVYGADYRDMRSILRAKRAAVGKTAVVNLKLLLKSKRDRKLMFTHNRPDCNVWVVYRKAQEKMISGLELRRVYLVEFTITGVELFVVNGRLVSVK
jgi:hypothetical protein